MMKSFFTILTCFFALSVAYPQAASQVSLKVTSEDTLYTLGKENLSFLPSHIEAPLYLKDALALAAHFVQQTGYHYPIAPKGNITWLKFTIQDLCAQPLYLEIYPHMVDSVALYAVNPDSSFEFCQTGLLMPFRERGLAASNQNLPLLGKKNEPQTYYMRLVSPQPFGNKIRLGSYDAMVKNFHQRDLLNGILFGILSIVVLFNFLMFKAQNENTYLWYSLYLLCAILVLSFYNGILHEYIFPNTPSLNRFLFLPLLASLLLANLFAISFLNIKKMSTPCYVALQTINAAYIVFAILGFSDTFLKFSLQLAVLGSIPSISISMVAATKNIIAGIKSAWFYILGWTFFGISIILYIADILFESFEFADAHTIFYGGIILQVLMLTLAIFSRISDMRQEKQKANIRALQAMQEKQSFIAEQNQILEKSVMDRTQDLQQALLREQQIEQQIREYAEKLENSNHELTDFAHLISHDLKAPLRNIASFAELLRKRNESKFSQRDNEFMGFIIKGSKQATQLVEDLLNFAKIDKDLGEPKPLFLCKVLDTVRFNLEGMITSKNGAVNCGMLPVIEAHSALLTQLFQNLISNGLKYNEDESPIVEIGFEEKQAEIVFFVRDNGIGIPPQYQQEIFKMFRRLHTSEQYEGSGIGLAFCKKIVENYHGDIWLQSEAGKGTTFFFTLPNAKILSMNPRAYMMELTQAGVAIA